MSFSASTAPPESERAVSDLIGFGGTDSGTIDALFRPRQRSAPVGSGTTKMSLAAIDPGTLLACPTERVLENFLSTEADAGALRWNEPRGLMTFHSPTLIVTAVATRPMTFPPFAQYTHDRVFSLPVRWSLAPVLDATTAEQRIQLPPAAFSSTDPPSQPSYFLSREVSMAFAAAANELFEDGIESGFSRTLDTLLKTHGNAAVVTLEALVFSPTANPEVVSESLKLLGIVDHDDSRQYRRTLLGRLLHSGSARVRYAAALGLAAMDDPVSLPALLSAIERESHPRLRQYFQLVIDQLEATQQCLSS